MGDGTKGLFLIDLWGLGVLAGLRVEGIELVLYFIIRSACININVLTV